MELFPYKINHNNEFWQFFAQMSNQHWTIFFFQLTMRQTTTKSHRLTRRWSFFLFYLLLKTFFFTFFVYFFSIILNAHSLSTSTLFLIHCNALLIYFFLHTILWIIFTIIQWIIERYKLIKIFTNYVQNILEIFILFTSYF